MVLGSTETGKGDEIPLVLTMGRETPVEDCPRIELGPGRGAWPLGKVGWFPDGIAGGEVGMIPPTGLPLLELTAFPLVELPCWAPDVVC